MLQHPSSTSVGIEATRSGRKEKPTAAAEEKKNGNNNGIKSNSSNSHASTCIEQEAEMAPTMAMATTAPNAAISIKSF